MGIYHLSMKYHSRKKGHNTVFSAAYRRATRLYDKSTGQWFSSTKNQNVVFSKIYAPEDAPEWVKKILALQQLDPDKAAGELWSLVELSEKRKDARLDVDLNIALPKELTVDQCTALIEDFVKEELCLRDMIVDVNIHWEDGNPHVHIMGTTREILENGFGKKIIEFEQKKFLYTIRKAWASKVNYHYEINGFDNRVTHRSFKDLGLDTEPTKHIGSYGQILGEQSRIYKENASVQNSNCDLYFKRPDLIIKEVSLHNATFTIEDIRMVAQKRLLNNENLMAGAEEKYEKVISSLVHNQDLVVIGEDVKGNIRYATREYIQREVSLFEAVEHLSKDVGAGLNKTDFIKLLDEKYSYLNEGQRNAALHCISEKRIKCVIGKPGVGKTTAMKVVAEGYKLAGLNVIAVAPTGKVAEGLGEALGVDSYTVDSYLRAWKSLEEAEERHKTLVCPRQIARNQKLIDSLKKYTLTSKDIIILDEAGLLSTSQFAILSKKIAESGASIIPIGDDNQMNAICAGGAFRGITEKVGAYEIDEIMRQKVDWMKAASQQLSELNIRDGLKAYHDRGHLHMGATQSSVIDKLVDDYFYEKRKHQLRFDEQMVMAYTNEVTNNLNLAIRNKLTEYRYLADIPKEIDGRQYCRHDRIVFLKNQNKENDEEAIRTIQGDGKGIKNGTLGTIERFVRNAMHVRLDNGRKIIVDTNKYTDFNYGYALTVCKNQGNNADYTYGYIQPHLNSRETNVMGTRHKYGMKLYASHEDFKDFDHIIKTVGSNQIKDLAEDYSIKEENLEYFNRVKEYLLTSTEAQGRFTEIAKRCNKSGQEVWEDKEWKLFKATKDKRNQLAKMILTSWEEHKLFAGQAGLSKQYIERHSGGIVLPSDIEKRAEFNVSHFISASSQVDYLHNTIKADVGNDDFSKHRHYSEYTKLIAERNQLAHIICEDSVLHRPFIKAESLNWQELESLAKEHSRETLINEEYDNLLDVEKVYFDNVEKYKNLQKQYNDMWQDIQQATQNTDNISNDINAKIDKLKILENQKQSISFDIAQNFTSHTNSLELFDIDKQQVHRESYNHQISNLISHYDGSDEYKKCIKGWIEFDKIQEWNEVNDQLSQAGISKSEFDINDDPTRLEDLQKLSASTYGKAIKLSNEYIKVEALKEDLDIQLDKLRDKIVSNYNNNTMDSISDDIKRISEETNDYNVQAELEAYQVLCNNSKLSNSNDKAEDIIQVLDQEYERFETEKSNNMSSNLPINLRLNANRGLEKQQCVIAKTINIFEPEREVSPKFKEQVNLYDHNKQSEIQELENNKLERVKSKVIDVFNNQEKQPNELIDVYNDLQHLSDNHSNKSEQDNIKQLSKALAREIQANPESLILAKAKNMEISINKTAEIEIQVDIVSQYKEIKEKVEEQRNSLLPDFRDKEAMRDRVANEENLLHLARVIDKQPGLKTDLDNSLSEEITKYSEEYQINKSRAINKTLNIEHSKGMEISYSVDK